MHQNSKIPLVKPPDGGWGWVIVLSCFMVTVCTRAISRCISIFFVEFQNHFAQDYAMTAWIHSTVDCTTMLFAPIGSVISNRYSCRISVILGGLLASAGLILSSFANCLEYLYLSLGVLTGCGYALAYSPSIAIVGEYFHKRKAMAYGIAMSGTGIGTFILAPVVQLLIERYSWRGALLILGGLVLNICVCGALLRPLTRTDNRTRTTVTEKAPEACTYKVQCDNLPLHCSVSHSVLTKIDCSNQQSCCYCPSYQEYTFLLTPDFLIFAVSVLFLSYGCSTPFVYLVPYAINVGVSQQQAAFLMSILGIMDIVGTISFGWITDRRCLKKYRRFCFFLTIGLDGFSSLFIPILKTFPLLVPYAFCYGYFDGAYIALLPVVTSDAAGREFLSSALGIVYFIHAIPYLIGPPIAGWLVNTTGTYTAAFFISGLSMMFSSLLVISADWIMSCRNSAKVQEVKTDGNIATFHNVANDHI